MNPHRANLQAAYAELPPTTCDRRGNCCSVFVQITHTEYLHLREYTEQSWTSDQRAALTELVQMQYTLRQATPPERSAKRAYRMKPHCLLYDEEEKRCTVYSARPYACRAFGFGGECSLVRLKADPSTLASDARTQDQLAALESRVLQANQPTMHRASGKRIESHQKKPIEFWFALDAVGWDPTLDPEDAGYLGKRNDDWVRKGTTGPSPS